MSPGRIAAGHGRAVKAIIALIAALACLGGVVYAATRPEQPAASLGDGQAVGVEARHETNAPRGAREELPRSRFIEFPDATSTASEVQFRFHVPPRTQRPGLPLPGPPDKPKPLDKPKPRRPFQCRLDDRDWRNCSSPYHLRGLAPGGHVLAVRAFNRDHRPGPAASYSWWRADPPSRPEQVDPKPFAIEAQGELEDLYPGYPPQPVPVLITNPNSAPIEVTSLTIAIADDPSNCSAENFALTPSSASPSAPLTVPASSSVSLPTATISAPTVSMLDLAVNQDACREAEVPLVFNGEAHG